MVLQHEMAIVSAAACRKISKDHPPASPLIAYSDTEVMMEKQGRSDIATFPELFGANEAFFDNLSEDIRRTTRRLAIAAIPASTLLLFVLSKAT